MSDPATELADARPPSPDRQHPPAPLGVTPAYGGSEIAIEARDLTFGYPDAPIVLDGINIQVGRGEILSVIGPSGCGKSTVLNLVAGLLRPTAGEMLCFGEPIRTLNRRVTYMTQKDTLLPWRSSLDNVALPLEINGVSKRERYERARSAMARVGVSDAEGRRPHQLSGGMRARVSLARTLMSNTDIVLMDEPFAAVDALRRVRLQQLLLDLWAETTRTMIYVTHDLNEAIALGHRVLVMSSHPGRLYLEKPVPAPQPRDAARFHATSEARALHVELWDGLERQFGR